MRVTTAAPDRTALLVADEVDRVKGGREQLRNTFDHGRVGKVLIEMAGIETPLARYPQLDSGIGFVREFRPLGAGEIRRLLKQGWLPPDVNLPGQPWDPETIATIIRMTGGNFRLFASSPHPDGAYAPNQCSSRNDEAVVEAGRECLVIGAA